jgi:murein DD-endopeptidase MepM/ murein hydrolase activator NlpD
MLQGSADKNSKRFGTLELIITTIITLILIFDFWGPGIPIVKAVEQVEAIKSKINQRTEDIQALEKEIQGYQKQIEELNGQASSLSGTIKSLELTKKKLETNISVIENKISLKNQEIKSLSSKIKEKEGDISDNKRLISSYLAMIGQLDGKNIPEIILSGQSVSDTFDDLDSLNTVQKGLQDKILSLKQTKTNLESNKKSTEKAKTELLSLQKELADQKKIVVSTSDEKNTLLKQTKQSESSYKKMLLEKQALKDAFEREIFDYESQLKLVVDPNKLPGSGTGILVYPLSNIRITQYFGNTSFATKNPQIYNGRGHTGIDFGASVGTPVKSAGSGTVVGVANTDIVRGCYSYGKWIMIKHPNGLSTLYAHLSLQKVSIGDTVLAGEIIGYSGNTGYSTGPHLHFGVYATEGVKITKLTNSKNCRGATMPLADFKAYLNPLSYL